ncbi:MAG: DUF2807 domain-containing protein [Legionella sp.]|nr:DUF2807 domain-containing protein [Legionella sp.]
MLKRPLLLICLTLLLLGCARTPLPQTVLPVVKKTTQTRAVAAYNDVVAEGRINVSLHTGYAKPQVILRGDPRDLAKVVTIVHNGTLLVSIPNDSPRFGPVTAEIRTRFLNSFTYKGVGTITGQRINSSFLDLSITNPGRTIFAGNIYLHKLDVNGPGYVEINGVKAQNLQLSINGKARVKLAGYANVSTINLDGDAWLGLYWVKSNVLTIRARGHTFLQLGGIVNKLDVELWDYARFNGRYLRAVRTFAKTHGRSVAEITALDRQHTLATDASNIYFYEIPEMKTDFMAYNGSVLDMRDLSDPFVEEYTPYNK